MRISRRDLLGQGAMATTAQLVGADRVPPPRAPLGVVIHSFAIRSAVERERFNNPRAFFEHTRALGAAGAQVALGTLSSADALQLKDAAQNANMYLEGIVSLPRGPHDRDRFSKEIRSAATAGASVVRTVLLNGRRYEVFNSRAAFDAFVVDATEALRQATRVIDDLGCDVALAVENHKDLRADQLIQMLKRVGSDRVRVCLDTGNSVALLEDPAALVQQLAPWAITTHFKDMAVEEYRDGFLLSEVPLGTGFLDLKAIVATLRKANPAIRLNLEMITRDPLRVPCLTEPYWSTLGDVPGSDLARALQRARSRPPDRILPRVSDKPRGEQLRIEQANVVACLEFARASLIAD